jgi:hypothetical protein
LRRRFHERRKHGGIRPPRSFDHRIGPAKAVKSSGSERLNFVIRLNRAGQNKARAYLFQPLSKKERRRFSRRGKEVRTYQKVRQIRETQRLDRLKEKALKQHRPSRETFPRSPILDRSIKKAYRKKALSRRSKVPRPKPNVVPLRRKYGLSRTWDRSQKSIGRVQSAGVRGKRSMHNVQKPGHRRGLSESRTRKSNNRQHRGDDGRRRWNARQRLR